MNMYQSGELDEVMKSFERDINIASIYIGCKIERADKKEILINGRYTKRYRANDYYNNGTLNSLFIMYLHGYASGKSKSINDAI